MLFKQSQKKQMQFQDAYPNGLVVVGSKEVEALGDAVATVSAPGIVTLEPTDPGSELTCVVHDG